MSDEKWFERDPQRLLGCMASIRAWLENVGEEVIEVGQASPHIT